jgi:hypothetical protein
VIPARRKPTRFRPIDSRFAERHHERGQIARDACHAGAHRQPPDPCELVDGDEAGDEDLVFDQDVAAEH